jgi:colicin import membrane protein
MFRKHETSVAWKAGFLAVLVHVLLVGIMLFSFQWKSAHSVVSVSDVMLWDSLPDQTQPLPQPKLPKVEPKPEPEVKEEPTPEPEPEPEPKVEPEPKQEEPKVDIELENKKKKEAEKKRLEEEKKKAEAKKKELAKEKKRKERLEKLKKIQEAAFDDEVIDENEKRLKDLQAMNEAEFGKANQQASSAASQSIVDKYIAKIQAKVRGNVNKTLCEDGNPEPKFKISLLPNGEFNGQPTLTKSSGNTACDAAVERAIIASEPFPLPTEPEALARFRDLNLKFKPNAN